MRLGRLGQSGQETPVIALDNGTFLDLRSVTEDIDGKFFASGGLARVRQALAAGGLAPFAPPPAVRVGAPIATPAAVICLGLNYAAHAAESGARVPQHPVVFFKHPNTVVGPNDPVSIPRGRTKVDWEVELGVVIGRRVSSLAPDSDVADAIAGFVVVNDLSERALQLEQSGGQWSKGKSLPGFAPTGPWMVTPDDVDVGSLHLQSFVNSVPRQDSTTADMIFSVDQIVRDLSHFSALEPGDLILTGTPEGVALSGRFPYLSAGDVCELEIHGLGRQRQVFVDG